MSLDRTTEAIAHLVGHFDLILDGLRMRAEYNTFKAEQKADEEHNALSFTKVNIKSGYSFEDVDPQLKYAPAASWTPNSGNSKPGEQNHASSDLPYWGNWGPVQSYAEGFGSSNSLLLPYVSMPSSIVTANLQMITLFDADIVGPGTDDFTTPYVYYQQLVAYSALAEMISGPGSDALDAFEALRYEDAHLFVEEMRAFEIPHVDGLEATLVRDGDVVGIRINGETVEEVPDLETLLPQAIIQKYGLDEEEEEEVEDVPDYHLNPVLDKDELDTENPYAQDPGHHVHSGMNEASNSVNLTTSMIDAGVVVVGGDVTNVLSVSQVNVVRDMDEGTSVEDMQTQAYNIAEVVFRDEAYQEDEDGNPIEPEEGDPVKMDHPDSWNLRVYEGDVMTVNVFTQHTFALDSDRIDFTFSAGATMLGTGENIMFNAANFREIGFGYDLVIVGGNMLDFTMISQTNVLLDDDQVWGAGSVDVSGGDNLLLNHASIQQYGIDSYEEITDHFSAQLDDLAAGSEEISSSVVDDDLFLGIDGLRVLYITGDLVHVTAVSQTNVVGDQDQVQLAMEEFAGDLDDVNVVTGSNALTNSAVIKDHGFNSVVMAGGEVYDDALMYQAGMIDTNAAPTGVDMHALANEAVAFLADDMLTPEYADDDPQVGHAPSTADIVDPMQTMTA